jgi:hypothetical protein
VLAVRGSISWDFYGDGDMAVTILSDHGQKEFLDVSGYAEVMQILQR